MNELALFLFGMAAGFGAVTIGFLWATAGISRRIKRRIGRHQ
jgi:hypothetical protein